MPNADMGNLLIAFQLAPNTFLNAECQTTITPDYDPEFFTGFTHGFFSEAIDINIGIKLGGTDSGKTSKGYGKFGAWNYNEQSEVKKFPIEFDEIDIERKFDIASPQLFLNTCLKKTFTKVIVVRLRDTGTNTAARPYLRLEFSEVLFTDVSWQDGETVKEKLKFRCRKFTSLYRTTDYFGSMGYAQPEPASWEYTMALASDDKK